MMACRKNVAECRHAKAPGIGHTSVHRGTPEGGSRPNCGGDTCNGGITHAHSVLTCPICVTAEQSWTTDAAAHDGSTTGPVRLPHVHTCPNQTRTPTQLPCHTVPVPPGTRVPLCPLNLHPSSCVSAAFNKQLATGLHPGVRGADLKAGNSQLRARTERVTFTRHTFGA